VTQQELYCVLGAIARAVRQNGGRVSADDLHEQLDKQEFPGDRRLFGMALAKLRRQGLLVPVGYIKSRRPECHHRPIMLFQEAGA
jgi:hypothetical protein